MTLEWCNCLHRGWCPSQIKLRPLICMGFSSIGHLKSHFSPCGETGSFKMVVPVLTGSVVNPGSQSATRSSPCVMLHVTWAHLGGVSWIAIFWYSCQRAKVSPKHALSNFIIKGSKVTVEGAFPSPPSPSNLEALYYISPEYAPPAVGHALLSIIKTGFGSSGPAVSATRLPEDLPPVVFTQSTVAGKSGWGHFCRLLNVLTVILTRRRC